MIKLKAFFISVIVAAFAYTWQVSAIHYSSHGVLPSAILGFFVLSLGIGLLSASILTLPVLYLLSKYRIQHFSLYLISASICMGTVVVVANNFNILQHPEGFIIGAFVGLLYWVLAKNDEMQNSIEK